MAAQELGRLGRSLSFMNIFANLIAEADTGDDQGNSPDKESCNLK